MTTVFERLAPSRPRLRRDVLFTETRTGVLFHDSNGGFEVSGKSAYRFASLVVPHLDGTIVLAELGAAFNDGQRVMLADLVNKLFEFGFARDSLPSEDPVELGELIANEFAAQIDYIDHFQEGAARRFARFRATTVGVAGDDPMARWCALSLVRNGLGCVTLAPPGGSERDSALLEQLQAETTSLNEKGCPVRVEYDQRLSATADWKVLSQFEIVVCTGYNAGRQVLALLSGDWPLRRSVLPVTALAGQIVVGPMMSGGDAVCWVCAMLRLGANGDALASAGLWTDICLPSIATPTPTTGDRLSAMLGNLLGYEVFRAVTGALPIETDGRIVIQNLDSLDSTTVQVLPHPRCPFCTRTTAAAPATDVDTAPPPDPPIMAAVTRPEDTDRLLAELNERNVLVNRQAGVFTGYDDDTVQQTPLKVSAVTVGLSNSARRTIAAFDVHHTAGARLRALRGAARVYDEYVVQLLGLLQDPAQADLTRLPPERLVTASGLRGPVADWVTATSLATGASVLIPAAAVRPFGPYNADRLLVPSDAGGGAGTSLAEAIHQGVHSVMCYAALMDATRGLRSVLGLRLSTDEPDNELRFLARSAVNLEVEVELVSLGENVVLARAREGEWAIAADTTLRAAAVTALRDLLGSAQLGREPSAPAAVDVGDPLIDAFDPATLMVSELVVPNWETEELARQAVDRLGAQGRDLVVVRTTAEDLRRGGLETVRVVMTA